LPRKGGGGGGEEASQGLLFSQGLLPNCFENPLNKYFRVANNNPRFFRRSLA